MIIQISGWVQVVGWSVIIGALLGNTWYQRRTYYAMSERLELAQKEVARLAGEMAEFNAIKYRLDIIEGKHLQGRQFGTFGLPQPRKRGNNDG